MISLLETHFIIIIVVLVLGICAVNNLRDQLDDMKKRNQNSLISNEKNIHLQKQVGYLPWCMFGEVGGGVVSVELCDSSSVTSDYKHITYKALNRRKTKYINNHNSWK